MVYPLLGTKISTYCQFCTAVCKRSTGGSLSLGAVKIEKKCFRSIHNSTGSLHKIPVASPSSRLATISSHEPTMPTGHSNQLPTFSAAQNLRASNALAHCIGMLQACESPAQQKALLDTVSKDTQTCAMTISTPVNFSRSTKAVPLADAEPKARRSPNSLLEFLQAPCEQGCFRERFRP